ncbi:MAG: tetratricopeptide repeat protein [Longimicrobiales bacterium]|nr:tetratricopeptide repeat protein [Longimicrobiales bacterium]
MDVEDLLRQALALGEEGDWEGMARELSHALESVPGDPALLCWLGVAERELGLPGSARERFKEALAQEPEDPYVLATIGNGLAQFDDPDAEAALRSAAVLAPDLPLARWLFGAYLSREGLHEDAMRELTAASELAPHDPAIAYEVGVALALQGEMEQALDALMGSVEMDQGEGWSQVVLGLVEAELDQMEAAARDLSEGARLRPHDVEAQFLAALAAEATGFEDLAYEMMERGRQGALPGDLPLLEMVEDRLEQGAESARDFLVQELLPGVLRERLMNHP